jgi:two-component system response regulator GlrR
MILLMAQPRIHIEIVDATPEQPIGTEIQAVLNREGRYRAILVAQPYDDRTEVTTPRPALIVLVLPTAKNSAAKLLASFGEKDADTPILPVLQFEDLNHLLDALSLWTDDFLVLPLRTEEVLSRIRRLLSRNKRRALTKPREKNLQLAGLARLVGEDPVFVALKQKLPLVARYGAPVLLTGETGTGKELCARALHYLSARSARAFLPVNCGAIPVELFESELFGHKKGAFTGASDTQVGLIEEADGGTLFLDEIDSLSPAAQVKLLRFIEDHKYHSLGSAKERQADVWIIAATNRDLKETIRHETFREDLYYRLAVMSLSLPPLRDRRADIPLLVNHLWSRYAEERDGDSRQFSPRALEALCEYSWPGNIRELENVIQQLLVMTDVRIIEPEHLPIALPAPPSAAQNLSFNQARAQIIAQFEKAYVTDMLQSNGGNVSQSAKAAKKERRSFGRLIKKYQLEKR